MFLDLDQTTSFRCTHCKKSNITPDPNSESSLMNGLSVEHRQYHATASEWDDTEVHAFTLKLTCPNPTCNGVTFATGRLTAIPEYDGAYRTYSVKAEPRYFFPPVEIVPIPDCTPQEVQKELMKSFELYFCDPTASANSLRKAAEAFLLYAGIPQTNAAGKFVMLGDRIKSFKDVRSELAEHLSAIKLLGNDGSHYGESVTESDLDAGYKIFFHVITEYVQPSQNAIAASIQLLARGRKLLDAYLRRGSSCPDCPHREAIKYPV